MESLIGRKTEIATLTEALHSPQAELIAVYGRRRVGKTYLIRTVYENDILIELTGLNNRGFTEQLENFSLNVNATLGVPVGLEQPQTWLQAFYGLRQVLEAKLAVADTKKVIFFDELPWFDSHKAGFLA